MQNSRIEILVECVAKVQIPKSSSMCIDIERSIFVIYIDRFSISEV